MCSPSGRFAEVRDLNNRGEMVGFFGPGRDGGSHAFLGGNGKWTDLGTLGGHSQASAINDAGVVVGQSLDANHQPRVFVFQ